MSVGLWRDNTPSFPCPQISRRCSPAGGPGVHLSGLQPSAGQFFSVSRSRYEASAIPESLKFEPREFSSTSVSRHISVRKPSFFASRLSRAHTS